MLALLFALTVAMARADVALEIEVVDAAGSTVADAQATIFENDTVRWWPGAGNGILLDRAAFPSPSAGGEVERSFTLIVRAPGFATKIDTVKLPAQAKHRVVLATGREITLTLGSDGEIPEALQPQIFWSPYGFETWVRVLRTTNHEQRLSFAVVERIEDGRFQFVLPNEVGAFCVIIDAPDFLRGFQSEPIDTATLKDGLVDLPLPSPGSVSVDFHQGVDAAPAAANASCGFTLSRLIERPADANAFYGLITRDQRGTTIDTLVADLAPGKYNIEVYTGTSATRRDQSRADYFNDQRSIEVNAGTNHKASFDLAHFDPTTLHGDYVVHVSVKKQDGSPAAGLPYMLQYNDRRFGRKKLAQGAVAADGTFDLRDLPGGPRALHLDLQVGDDLNASLDLHDGQNERPLALALPPTTGDLAPNLTLMDAFTGERMELSSLSGQVVLVDFWATWCGPCQEPMRHNSEILTRRARDWAGKATILGLSIDNTREVLIDHVRLRRWDNVHHVWACEGNPGWESTAVKTYGIRGVPTALLLDPSGRIVWRGHPATIDVEKKIDELVQKTSAAAR